MRFFYFINTLFLAFIMLSCERKFERTNLKADTTEGNKDEQQSSAGGRVNVLSAKEQALLTPDMIIDILKKGNDKFVNNELTLRDHSAMVRNTANGQFPMAVVLSCLDSRVPVEDLFNRGIGDLFVVRIAGNFSNQDILGSMEYGCKVSGAKLILVLGHVSCGAIKAAIDKVKLGNITAMLTKISPSVEKSKNFPGVQSSKNPKFVENVAINNVINTIAVIKSQSPILKKMSDRGEIKIIGAYYSIKTGRVIFL